MTQRILEFHIGILGASPRMTSLGILEFLGKILEFLRINLELPKQNLEFLGQNLEFLEIASAFSKPRNDEFYRILEFPRNSRIPSPRGSGCKNKRRGTCVWCGSAKIEYIIVLPQV